MPCDDIKKAIHDKQVAIAAIQKMPPGKERTLALAQAQKELQQLQENLESCEKGLWPLGVRSAKGKVNYLRIHDSGEYGAAPDSLRTEVVLKLDKEPARAFGFSLKNDADGPSHQGMLALVQAAYLNKLDLYLEYIQELNKFNSKVFMIVLSPLV